VPGKCNYLTIDVTEDEDEPKHERCQGAISKGKSQFTVCVCVCLCVWHVQLRMRSYVYIWVHKVVGRDVWVLVPNLIHAPS